MNKKLSFRSETISNHESFINAREDSLMKIYNLTINSSILKKYWIELYGEYDNSIKHMLSEKYLIELESIIEKKNINLKINSYFKSINIIKWNVLLPEIFFRNNAFQNITIFVWKLKKYIYSLLFFLYLFFKIFITLLHKNNNEYYELQLFSNQRFDYKKKYLGKSNNIYNFLDFVRKNSDLNSKSFFSTKDILKYKSNLKIKIKFITRSIKFIVYGIYELFRTEGFSCHISHCLIKAEYIKCLPETYLPKIIFYEIHSSFLLPSELVALKKKNVYIIMFEFSLSYFFPQTTKKEVINYSFYTKQSNNLLSINWTNKYIPNEIWCHDDISKMLIHDYLQNDHVKYKKVGLIPVGGDSNTGSLLPKFKDDNLKLSIFANFGNNRKLYSNDKVLNLFLLDILEIIERKKINAYFKCSKKIKGFKKNQVVSKYSSNRIVFTDEIKLDVSDILEPLSSRAIISETDIVICSPFTSPAYEAKLLKKIVFFYDPLGVLENNKRLLRDIPIIKSKEQLSKKIDKYL